MKTKEFEEIVNAAFNLGFQAGLWPSKKYDEKEQKKAKRKLLKLQQRHLTSAMHSDGESRDLCDCPLFSMANESCINCELRRR